MYASGLRSGLLWMRLRVLRVWDCVVGPRGQAAWSGAAWSEAAWLGTAWSVYSLLLSSDDERRSVAASSNVRRRRAAT